MTAIPTRTQPCSQWPTALPTTSPGRGRRPGPRGPRPGPRGPPAGYRTSKPRAPQPGEARSRGRRELPDPRRLPLPGRRRRHHHLHLRPRHAGLIHDRAPRAAAPVLRRRRSKLITSADAAPARVAARRGSCAALMASLRAPLCRNRLPRRTRPPRPPQRHRRRSRCCCASSRCWTCHGARV